MALAPRALLVVGGVFFGAVGFCSGAVLTDAERPPPIGGGSPVAPLPGMPTQPLKSAADVETSKSEAFQDNLTSLAQKTLTAVVRVNNKFLHKVHALLCEKQTAMSATGTYKDGAPVCQRSPAGFDKDRDCPWVVTAFGVKERNLLSATCADLLEEEYIYNTTWTRELKFKAMQTMTQDQLKQEGLAVENEMAAQLKQIQAAGAATLAEEGGRLAPTAGASAGDLQRPSNSTKKAKPVWRRREEEAWLREMYGEAQDFTNAMAMWIRNNDGYHNLTLRKLAGDVNRSIRAPTFVNDTELIQHTNKYDCWAILSGDVYDFTPWIHTHPGGAARITGMCGKDVTSLWNAFHAAVGAVPTSRRMGKYNATGVKLTGCGTVAEGTAVNNPNDKGVVVNRVNYQGPLPSVAVGRSGTGWQGGAVGSGNPEGAGGGRLPPCASTGSGVVKLLEEGPAAAVGAEPHAFDKGDDASASAAAAQAGAAGAANRQALMRRAEAPTDADKPAPRADTP